MNIGFKEDMNNEFKSDIKKLSDDDIIEAVVAFANTDGGTLFLGVENDGNITGIHDSHKDITQLAAFIANKTVPPVSVRAELDGGDISFIRIQVPRVKNIVATSSGKTLRRRIKADGEPENVPLYPYEIATRLSDLSMLDYSALPVPEANYSDLDDNERSRLRSIIRASQGELRLLELDDEELDKALQLVIKADGKYVPTFCGMLLIGRADRLRVLVPTAETAFQVMNGTDVVVNDIFKLPLLASFEKIEAYVDARISETELDDGFLRISIPNYEKRAIREAVVNAFCHRDYTQLGTVRVKFDNEGLTISNPGGFIDGITLDNLLEAEPRGRNMALATALKRIGLAERTGRGIERIFEGSLKYGKPLPDYSESTSTSIKLFIPNSLPDKSFVKMLADEQKRLGTSLPINSLLVLNELQRNKRLNLHELSLNTHISEARTRQVVERLVNSGLVERVGAAKSRTFILSAKVYKSGNKTADYVRQKNIDSVRQPEMILEFVRSNGKITRADAADLLRISSDSAYKLLKNLCDKGRITLIGKGKSAYYVISE